MIGRHGPRRRGRAPQQRRYRAKQQNRQHEEPKQKGGALARGQFGDTLDLEYARLEKGRPVRFGSSILVAARKRCNGRQ